MTAAVVGGGVAGPVVAVGLLRAGIQPVIYEARNQGEVAGPRNSWWWGLAHPDSPAWVTIAANGLAAIRHLGLDTCLQGEGFPTPVAKTHTADGRRLPSDLPGGVLPDGTAGRTVWRRDLCQLSPVRQVLSTEAVRQGARLCYGRRLTAVHRPAPPATATATATGVLRGNPYRLDFADGTQEAADIVVGADGLASLTRLLLNPDTPAPDHGRLHGVASGVSRGPSICVKAGCSDMVVCSAGTRVSLVQHPSGDVWWSAVTPWPPPDREDCHGNWLADMLALEGAAFAASVVSSSISPVRCLPLPQTIAQPKWNLGGSAVVIGDAARGGVSPSSQGVAQAMEDAVTLSWLFRYLPATEALGQLERMRQARARVNATWFAQWEAGLKSTFAQQSPSQTCQQLFSVLSQYWTEIVSTQESESSALDLASEILTYTIPWDREPARP
eukprot:gene12017-2191_t